LKYNYFLRHQSQINPATIPTVPNTINKIVSDPEELRQSIEKMVTAIDTGALQEIRNTPKK